jgi:predicted transcriptional regulator
MNNPDLFHLAACSNLRRNILIFLNEHEKSLGDLRDGLKISSTTALHALKELEKSKLTFQNRNKNYGLTNIGRIITLELLDFSSAEEVLKKHERFWLEHDLSGIPDQMLGKIGWLNGSNLVEDTATDIFRVHTNFITLLAGAKEIKGISSIYVPEYMNLFSDLIINKNADVELILTKEVMEKIDKTIINNILSDKSFKFKLYMTKEETRAAFTVTDTFFSLGLYHNNGNYDYNRDLLSYEKKGIEWGKNLFEWYLQQAERS